MPFHSTDSMFNRPFHLLFYLLLLMLLSSACASTPKPPASPEELYHQAVSAATPSRILGTRDCQEVERIFTEMRTRYPYHQRALDLESLLADCYFAQGEYAQAAAHWRILVENYPRHEKAPEYLFRLIQAYMKMTDDYDRDLSYAQSAWAYADEFLRTHPTHPHVQEVLKLRNAARSLIARRELYVARFYLKQDSWLSAWDRLRYLTREFYDLPEGREGKELMDELLTSRPVPRKITEDGRTHSTVSRSP